MDILLTGLVGLTGVLVGGALTGVMDLWRQLIDGKSAARIIRMEIQENVNRAVQAINRSRPDIRLRDDGWKDLRVKLVPLLPDEVLLQMSSTYGAIFIVEEWISKIQQKPQEANTQIRQWIDNATLHAGFLIQLSRRSRVPQMVDLLLGKPTFPPPGKGERPAEERLAEMKKKLFEVYDK